MSQRVRPGVLGGPAESDVRSAYIEVYIGARILVNVTIRTLGQLAAEAATQSGRLATESSSTLAAMAKKYREIRNLLRAAGWAKVRQTGSHETWESPDGSRAVTVAGKDSDTVPAGTLAAMRRATRLELR